MAKVKTTFAEPPEDDGPKMDTHYQKMSEPDPRQESMFPTRSKSYVMRSIHARNQDAHMRYSEDYYKPQSEKW